MARALDAAHAAGLVHLDVKPENILLTHDHFTYLADFGIAEAAGDESLSRTYMAPERFTTGRIGSQTDVYSLACVLYECLTGQPPFETEDAGELKSAHLLSPAPRPSIMRRGVGRDYDDIITRGMAKQRTARFDSAGALARPPAKRCSRRTSRFPLGPASSRSRAPVRSRRWRFRIPAPTATTSPSRPGRRAD